MGRTHRLACRLLVSSFLAVTFSVVSVAQTGGVHIADDPLSQLTGTTLKVQIRDANGAVIKDLGVATLSTVGGAIFGSQMTFSSRAEFSQVKQGLYWVSVEVPGFKRGRVQANIPQDFGEKTVTINLESDTSGASVYSSSAGVHLSSKAQKQIVRAVQDVQTNKFDDAIKRLESASQLAPTHPAVPYLLGVAYDKKNNQVKAMEYWEDAIKIDPKHVASLLAAGDCQLHQRNLESARQYFERALNIAPDSWMVHGLLAETLLELKVYPETVSHSQRAIQLGKKDANASYLTLGQALIDEGQNQEGITALESFLASNPPQSQAIAVRALIEHTKNPSIKSSSTNVPTVSTDELIDVPVSTEMRSWMPPNIDDLVPPVDPGISCHLNDVLAKTSAHAQQFVSVANRYTATEVLHQEDMTKAGYINSQEDLSFNYLVSINERDGKYVNVEEYRNGNPGIDVFPDHVVTVGLSSMALIFHPYLIDDFEMHCEGLARANQRLAWQVRFEQKKNKPSRIHGYNINGHIVPVLIKGRAWIDSNTFQIVRLETSLQEERPDLQMKAEHIAIQYGPVNFKSRKEEVWVPTTADYYVIMGHHRFHRTHTYTNYVLFSVDDQQKISAPPKPVPVADSSGTPNR